MYYLVIIQNNNTQTVYAYPTLDEALSVFHQELGYRSEARTSTVCVILDENGALVKQDHWKQENPED